MCILSANKRLYGTISKTRLGNIPYSKWFLDFIEPTEKNHKETQNTTSSFPPPASHTGSHLSFPKEINTAKILNLNDEQLYMSLRSKQDSSTQIHQVNFDMTVLSVLLN